MQTAVRIHGAWGRPLRGRGRVAKATGRITTVYDVTGIGPTLNGRNGGGERYSYVATVGSGCDGRIMRQPLQLFAAGLRCVPAGQ